MKTCQRLTTRFFYNADCCEHAVFSQNCHGLSEVSIFCSGDEQGLFGDFLSRLSGDAVQYNTESREAEIGIW